LSQQVGIFLLKNHVFLEPPGWCFSLRLQPGPGHAHLQRSQA
jgi:hypothetical protein